MTVVALVMAGGKGSRMNLGEEKPLIRVLGTSMLERVICALKGATKVGRIIVAVTYETPKTAVEARRLGVEILLTPGRGYIEDMRYAIKNLGLDRTLVMAVDLPFLRSEIIDEFIAYSERCGKPALSLVAPFEKYTKLGLRPDYILNMNGTPVVPVGVNIIEGTKIDDPQLDQVFLLTEEVESVININTVHDLTVAERTFSQNMKGLQTV
jgi:adenosylcobinamide-phosphate guanylyltransferase